MPKEKRDAIYCQACTLFNEAIAKHVQNHGPIRMTDPRVKQMKREALQKAKQMLYPSSKRTKYIYIFAVRDREDYKYCLKIGDTKDFILNRLKDINGTAGQYGCVELVYAVMAVDDFGNEFRDHAVHSLLDKLGYVRQYFKDESRHEWFVITSDEAIALVQCLITGSFPDILMKTFKLRPHQIEAVKAVVSYFLNCPNDDVFMLAMKPRSGKSVTFYYACRALGAKRIIVVTWKPVCEDAWETDIHHKDFKGWRFISRMSGNGATIQEQYEKCVAEDPDAPIVVFLSFQDLQDGEKLHHQWLFKEHWDVAGLDEYHFGAYRDRSQNILDRMDIAKRIYMTGTPYKCLSSKMFKPDQIFRWTYFDEQRAKLAWKGDELDNPYYGMPKMHILTYELSSIERELAEKHGLSEFSLNEFLRTVKDESGNDVFVYAPLVLRFLRTICGDADNAEAFLSKEIFQMPFSDPRLVGRLMHTLWVLPGVKECNAMAAMLRTVSFFKDYTIINNSGKSTGIGRKALQDVKKLIGPDTENTRSITLTCGKCCECVTVPQWSGVMMLHDTKTPEFFFQSSHRAGSKWVYSNMRPDGSKMKEDFYVFDFSPNRAISAYSECIAAESLRTGVPLSECFIECSSLLPFGCVKGGQMRPLRPEEIVEKLCIAEAAAKAGGFGRRELITQSSDELVQFAADSRTPSILDRALGGSLGASVVKLVLSSNPELVKPSNRKRLGFVQGDPKDSDSIQELLLHVRKILVKIPNFLWQIDECAGTFDQFVQLGEKYPDLLRIHTGLEAADFDFIKSICRTAKFSTMFLAFNESRSRMSKLTDGMEKETKAA